MVLLNEMSLKRARLVQTQKKEDRMTGWERIVYEKWIKVEDVIRPVYSPKCEDSNTVLVFRTT